MGLLPLEFSECYTDSPYFRDNIHTHEAELERTSQAIKQLIKESKTLLQAARNLSKAQRSFCQLLQDFKFECIGSTMTDDEIEIESSFKEFGRLIGTIEDERDRMLENASAVLIEPLERFRKDQIHPVKEEKKKFEKQTEKFCTSLDTYMKLSAKKQNEKLQEADAQLDMEKRHFHESSLQYVFKLQEVQERKKFEFVETLLGFMYAWLTFYHQGHEVAREFRSYGQDLQLRLQNTRERFESTRTEAEHLMRKMQEKPIEQGPNKMYTKQGYLFVQEKRPIGYAWVKHYCMYQKENKIFTMIPYTQTQGKLTSSTETIILKSCVRRMSDSIDKRFCFDIMANDKATTITVQAMSEDDRKAWLEAMDGKEPIGPYQPPPEYRHKIYQVPGTPSSTEETPYPVPVWNVMPFLVTKKSSVESITGTETCPSPGCRWMVLRHDLLNDIGFTFIKRCIQSIETRGIEEQGLYRVVGVNSKVKKLTELCLVDRRKADKVDLDEYEIKTITSALKNYFSPPSSAFHNVGLPEPLLTFKLHQEFINAAKQESRTLRINDIHRLVHQLPESNFEMLDMLIGHLLNVANHSKKNLMSKPNLGVVFGPTLMRPAEETVAAIMDIKFQNIIVEILISNHEQIFKTAPEGQELSYRGTRALPVASPREVAKNAQFPMPSVPPPTAAPPAPPPASAKPTKANRPVGMYSPNPTPAPRSPTRTNSTTKSTENSSGAYSNSHSSSSESLISRSSNDTQSSQSSPQLTRLQGGTHLNNPVYSSLHLSSNQNQNCQPSTKPEPLRKTKHPRKFVCLTASLTPSPPSSRPAQNQTSGAPAPMARLKSKCVKALYACEGENEQELSFRPGQIIYNVKPSNEPGWLEGWLDGKKGLLPENYVEPF
ncbi:rho GTPase-activating protein 26-like isoform X4 [Branchiostoma floridae]|uniref:Rho GTPase-activating protein 26-like isoform X4 n=1 Tax=Branchiostoma floridae TaxID=7739 RepID=A0A9J7MWI5_BRAFL|nr:rho GTPase-activating protein 26-like isoform X4 [Branchiostoma floridae]